VKLRKKFGAQAKYEITGGEKMKPKEKYLIAGILISCGIVIGVALSVRFDLLPPAKTQAPDNAPAESLRFGLEESFVRVAEEVGPAVVSISTESTERVGGFYRGFGGPSERDFFDEFFKDFFGQIPEREYKRMGLGSGVIIDKQGYILTNAHVIEGADKITVTLPDGRDFKGEVKGTDPFSDLAVVKIKANGLPVATLGDSDNLRIGQWVLAIGNPFAFAVGSSEPTVTSGIISALHRSLPRTTYRDKTLTDLIQTDAAINPGNSGGPLVNLKGEVIGINVAIFSTSGGNQGIGFAIPISTAKRIIDELISGKEVLYGWLGVSIQDLTQDLADYFGIPDQHGAVVVKVLADSPAEKAGLKESDVIRKFNGTAIKDIRQLITLVSRTEVGTKVKLEIIRHKKSMNVTLVVGKRPSEITTASAKGVKSVWRGLKVENITAERSRRYGLEQTKGVIVTEVKPGSPADEAGIIRGDVITKIGDIEINNLSDYNKATAEIKGEVLVKTRRGYAVLKP
jgi:serine protease Do